MGSEVACLSLHRQPHTGFAGVIWLWQVTDASKKPFFTMWPHSTPSFRQSASCDNDDSSESAAELLGKSRQERESAVKLAVSTSKKSVSMLDSWSWSLPGVFHQPPTTGPVPPPEAKSAHSSCRKHKNVFVGPTWLECWVQFWAEFGNLSHKFWSHSLLDNK